jgi:hypothetical protein
MAAVAVAFVLALTGVVAVPGPAVALVGGQLGQWHYNPATGHVYQQVNDLTWEEAEAYAVGVGGHLVTINDQAEDDWLEATFTGENLWIGFTDRDVEGTWVWSSGEPVTYTDWCPGQPDDWQDVGGEDYGFMNPAFCGGSGWDDAAGGPFPGGIVEVTPRTLTTRAFSVGWSPTNPEEILFLSWKGSPNLTNSSPNLEYPCGGDSEFFGNSWGLEGGANWAAPVGAGTTGQWSAPGFTNVRVRSSAAGCFGTSDIPGATHYTFFPNGAPQNRVLVQRAFSFGSTPFAVDFRPYVPRLYPRDSFDTVVHPNASGTNLIVEDVNSCEFGCLVTDWDETWFAVHDQYNERGMIVRHMPSANAVALWVDADGYSQTTASSVALLQPAGGFTGTVIETEVLCFYDSTSWTPSLKLPKGCQ